MSSSAFDALAIDNLLIKDEAEASLYLSRLSATPITGSSSEEVGRDTGSSEEMRYICEEVVYICDGCHQDPLVGNMYKCQQCPDYELCEECMTRADQLHPPGGHHLLRFRGKDEKTQPLTFGVEKKPAEQNGHDFMSVFPDTVRFEAMKTKVVHCLLQFLQSNPIEVSILLQTLTKLEKCHAPAKGLPYVPVNTSSGFTLLGDSVEQSLLKVAGVSDNAAAKQAVLDWIDRRRKTAEASLKEIRRTQQLLQSKADVLAEEVSRFPSIPLAEPVAADSAKLPSSTTTTVTLSAPVAPAPANGAPGSSQPAPASPSVPCNVLFGLPETVARSQYSQTPLPDRSKDCNNNNRPSSVSLESGSTEEKLYPSLPQAAHDGHVLEVKPASPLAVAGGVGAPAKDPCPVHGRLGNCDVLTEICYCLPRLNAAYRVSTMTTADHPTASPVFHIQSNKQMYLSCEQTMAMVCSTVQEHHKSQHVDKNVLLYNQPRAGDQTTLLFAARGEPVFHAEMSPADALATVKLYRDSHGWKVAELSLDVVKPDTPETADKPGDV